MKELSQPSVALGDLVVGTLPLDSRFAGSNTSEEDGLLRAINIHRTSCFGGEVKPSIPCHELLRHVKELYRYEKRYFVTKIFGYLFQNFCCFTTVCLEYLLPGNSVYEYGMFGTQMGTHN
jgi:hypothetical protein